MSFADRPVTTAQTARRKRCASLTLQSFLHPHAPKPHRSSGAAASGRRSAQLSPQIFETEFTSTHADSSDPGWRAKESMVSRLAARGRQLARARGDLLEQTVQYLCQGFALGLDSAERDGA